MGEDQEHGKHSNNFCGCTCHAVNMEYRLVNGMSFEGLSIRDIYYDKQGRIVGWGRFPLSSLTATPKEMAKELVEAMKHIDDMLIAAQKPPLEEILMEAYLQYRDV